MINKGEMVINIINFLFENFILKLTQIYTNSVCIYKLNDLLQKFLRRSIFMVTLHDIYLTNIYIYIRFEHVELTCGI